MPPILRLCDVHKTYAQKAIQIQALQGVSFDVAKGEFVSIVGRSGSGKSTLLNLVGGLDTASSGHIFLRKKDLTRMSRSELALHRRNTVGMVFQSFNLIPSRTALENLTLVLAFAEVRRRERAHRASEVLSALGLGRRLHHKPGELSGGEAQRVALARALINHPHILLADEPTGNLDSRTSLEILDLLQRLNQEQKLTVLLVTHDETSAATVSHRILRLLDGKVVDQTVLRSLS